MAARFGVVTTSFIAANGFKLDAQSNLDLLDRCGDHGVDPKNPAAVRRLAQRISDAEKAGGFGPNSFGHGTPGKEVG